MTPTVSNNESVSRVLADPALPWQCPQCGRPARVTTEHGGWQLLCERHHSFHAEGGIPVLCETDNYAESFGKEWLAHWVHIHRLGAYAALGRVTFAA